MPSGKSNDQNLMVISKLSSELIGGAIEVRKALKLDCLNLLMSHAYTMS